MRAEGAGAAALAHGRAGQSVSQSVLVLCTFFGVKQTESTRHKKKKRENDTQSTYGDHFDYYCDQRRANTAGRTERTNTLNLWFPSVLRRVLYPPSPLHFQENQKPTGCCFGIFYTPVQTAKTGVRVPDVGIVA